MAFPVVQATNTSAELSAVVAHDVSLPASVAANELLLALLGLSTGTMNAEGGWVEEVDSLVVVESRVADGGEGATVVFDSASSCFSGHNTYRISGGSSEVEIAVVNNSLDPPSLSPSWGAEDTLWIAGVIVRDALGTFSVTAAPTNYSGLIQSAEYSAGVGAVGSRLATAWRQLNAASEDPVAFTTDATVLSTLRAFTIAIRPATAEGALASSGSSALALVAAADVLGALAASGIATAAFDSSGVLNAAGVAAASFVGSVINSGALLAAGVGAVSFVGGLRDGVFSASGVGEALFSFGPAIDGDGVFGGLGDCVWVGETFTRWSSEGPTVSGWQSEAGGGYA